MKIVNATKGQSGEIAALIMDAMSDDCCQYLAGAERTLADFRRMMIRLVEMEHSQYSYRNTHVALDGDGNVAGICVAYRGADLHSLREAFIRAAKEYLGRDFSLIDDETDAGELYIDSLAVKPQYRHQGIASTLLRTAIAKAHAEGLPAGLLVDKGNPTAERLYRAMGFEFVNDKEWGGHPMRHLRCGKIV